MTEEQYKKSALRFVSLLGMVSLFADMTYEGAWSVAGSFLASLGASGAMVGFLAGFGEFVGQALRLVSGALVDRSKRYWSFTLAGYSVNMMAVPLLSLAGTWPVAAALLLLERFGKAIRGPAKDVILSHASSRIGTSFGFGIHEAMDQTGALIGPLLVAWALARTGGYPAGFQLLAIPASLALAALFVARWKYPDPEALEKIEPVPRTPHFSKTYWLFLIASGLMAAGFADFALVSFHFEKKRLFPASAIPLLYAVAMATDGIAALLMGRYLGKHRLEGLMGITLLLSASCSMMFLGSRAVAFAGLIVWGIGLGAIAALVKSTVAKLAPGGKRGAAYGYYNAVFGGGWFLGSTILGQLYDRSLPGLAAASGILELGAVVMFYRTLREINLQKAV